MTELTVKTPSQEIIDDANRIVAVNDMRGRNIEIRKMNMSIRRRVYKTISAENGEKDRYLGLAILAGCVVAIEGVKIPFPATEIQFDALIDRIGDDGFAAIGKAMIENFSAGVEATAGE